MFTMCGWFKGLFSIDQKQQDTNVHDGVLLSCLSLLNLEMCVYLCLNY